MYKKGALVALGLLSLVLTEGCAMTVDNVNDAAILAEKYIRRDRNEHNFVVIRSTVKEYDFGWVFNVYPEKYLLTGNRGELVPGADEILIDRDGNTYSIPSSIF